MRILDIFHDANANLFRNKVRSALTIVAIFVGSFAIITNTAIQTGVNAFIDEQINSYGGEDYIGIANKETMEIMLDSMMMMNTEVKEFDPNKNQTTPTAITAEQLEKLKNLDGIDPDSICEKQNITIDYITGDKTDKKYLIGAQGIPEGAVAVKAAAGTQPDNDSDEHEIMIMPEMSDALGYDSYEDAVGQEVTLGVIDRYTNETTEFTAKISGVSAPGVVSLGYSFVNQPLSDAIFEENNIHTPEEEKGKVYAYTASYDNKNLSSEEIYDRLKEIGLSGITVEDLVGSIKSFFDIMIMVLNIFGAIALVAASIGIINTLFMSVQERTREIGLDKALGMSSTQVFVNFSLEAILLGFWGSLVGVVVSMCAGNALNAVLHQEGQILANFPTFVIAQYPIQNIAFIILIVMFIAFLAGTLPALKASRKDPIDALRYE